MRAEYKDVTGRTVNFEVECSRRTEGDKLIGPPVETAESGCPLKLMGVCEGRAYYKINEHLSPGSFFESSVDPTPKAGAS